ncbi:follicle cell protein 3C-1 [Episyrphus balteatus]|uniref:follicle cell protein 3C-1 n=1 Tax=Episyrphus balteatus TaxID=286459 RepID=UPI002486CA2C|nr:follicle cell protein 3C-1 [Episyrphus balteatus]
MVFLKGLFVLATCLALVECSTIKKSNEKIETTTTKAVPSKANAVPTEVKNTNTTTPCTCGVFLTSQFTKGSDEQPKGDAAMIQDINKVFPCNMIGQKQCQTKCLESIVGHLPNSATVLCATLGRDIHKERAFLFIKNCKDSWINTNLAAGKEYCCKDGTSYQCPLV